MKSKIEAVFCETHGHHFVEKKASISGNGRHVLEVYCTQCGEVKVLRAKNA